MKLVKTLIVWILLLAIPLQGYASVSMAFCASGQAQVSAAPAEHVDVPHHGAEADSADQHCADKPGMHKCSACAACTLGAAIAPAIWPQAAAFKPLGSGRIPYVAVHVTAYVPSGLERPPHGLNA